MSHNLPAPSLHHQPGTCLGDVDGVGRAPCRDATEKGLKLVSELFLVCMRVCIKCRHVVGARSLNAVRSPVCLSSEEPQESSVRYPYIQAPTISGPFLSVKHNHTLLQPGYSVVAAIACKEGHLCFPGLFLFSAVSYWLNCL